MWTIPDCVNKISRDADLQKCVPCVVQEPPVTNSYFVLFNSQTAAAAAGQCCIFPEGAADAFRIMPAPGPEEVRCLMHTMQLDATCAAHCALLSHAWS